MIRLRVLGPVDLRDDEDREYVAVLAQPKRLALLVALVVGPTGFRRRDSLLALLWPELDQAHARAALNQALRFLRKELDGPGGAGILSRGTEEIGIDGAVIWCDAMAFREHVESGRHQEALDLYRGNLLEGFFVEEGDGFQEWLERERDLLRLTAAKSARVSAGLHERDGNLTPAVAAARRAVDLSQVDERAFRELLLLLDRLGDRAGALQAYQEFARRLSTDFGADPAPETRALIEEIRQRANLKHAVGGDGHVPGQNGSTIVEPARPATPIPHVEPVRVETPHSDHRSGEKGSTPTDVRVRPLGGQAMAAVVRGTPWLLVGGLLGFTVSQCLP